MVNTRRPCACRVVWFVGGLLLLLLLAGQQQVATGQNAPAKAVVRVGVLNWPTPVAVRWQTGIRMALEDYYAANPRSATSVELHFRNYSAGDVLGAASAALDLISNAQVQAIIGLVTSAEAEFVAQLGSRAHVPVLSYTATSPALSPAQTPFFVRTAPNDSFQAAPVAALIFGFGWRSAVVVHEDSPYGNGILPALADALQDAGGVAITDRMAVPSDATDDRIDAVLYHLKELSTRVLVVHMRYALVSRFFRRAKRAGLMSGCYVWIATDSVGTLVDWLDLEDADAMQGVVSLRPYVQPTDSVKNFSARFTARFRQEHPAAAYDLHEPSVMRLWAYDTAWAIAAAAAVPGPAFQTPQRSAAALTDLDRLGVSATGAALLKSLLGTTFDGMAGRFKLVDGQLQVAAYEVVNVIGKGGRTVGFWTPESGITQDANQPSSSPLKTIIWPGEPPSTPKGWTVSGNGRTLKVLVPRKNGFKQFVDVSGENTTGYNITGYCINVFDEVMNNLPYHVNYKYEPFHPSSESYDNLVDQVREKKADIVVGDVTITASRMDEVDYTMPFTESGWSMVVAVHKDTSPSMWIFLKPLTTSLWLASLAFFCFTGFVVWVIEHRVNPEFRGTPSQQFGLIFYFAFSTLVFSHKEKLESNLSRFVVIIWVFVVLILTSSYTASLTSMLTVQKLQPTVTDVRELQRHGHSIGYQEGTFIKLLLLKMGFDETRMRKYSTEEQYADALSKGSGNGGVAAVFDEIPYLKLFLSQYCDSYMMVGPVYKTDGFGFVFPRGSPMVADVSREVLRLAEGEKMARIEKAWFGDAATCRQSQSTAVSSSNLTFQSFGGLFLITGVVSSLMLLLYLATFAYSERDELRAAEAEAETASGGSGSGSVSVRRMRAWLQHYDRKDLKSPTFKMWNDESMRNGGGDSVTRTPRWNGGEMNMTPRAREEEEAMGGTSPLSVYISSEMNAGSSPEETPAPPFGSSPEGTPAPEIRNPFGSSPEGTPAPEFTNPFEQRIEGSSSTVEMSRPTTVSSQLQQ